jgi:hypothetical protein
MFESKIWLLKETFFVLNSQFKSFSALKYPFFKVKCPTGEWGVRKEQKIVT